MRIECFNTSCKEYGQYPDCVADCSLQQSRAAHVGWATPIIANDSVYLLPKEQNAVLLLNPQQQPLVKDIKELHFASPASLVKPMMTWALPDTPKPLAIYKDQLYVDADPYQNPSSRVMERLWWSLDGFLLTIVGDGLHSDSWKEQMSKGVGCYHCSRSISEWLGWNDAKDLSWHKNLQLAVSLNEQAVKRRAESQKINSLQPDYQRPQQQLKQQERMETSQLRKSLMARRIDANGNAYDVQVNVTRSSDGNWYDASGNRVYID